MIQSLLRCGLLVLAFASPLFAQANGRLQIHYIDVGQGDAAVLISPLGEVVLFDNGVLNQCGKPVAYLQALGITKIDYHVASHYHSDHIGCTAQVLGAFPLQKIAYDRGGSYTTATYSTYAAVVASKRQTATPGSMITLDAGAMHPVQILFVASNANGVPTTDENDKSLVALVRFGHFEAVFGGDLSGASTGTVDPDPSAPPPTIPPPPPPPPADGTCSLPAGAPASATAVCKDGTYSMSQNRSGTCSTHSGVSCWICPGALCSGLPPPPPPPPPPADGTCSLPAGAPASATAVCKDGTYSMSQNRSGTCSTHSGVSCWICPGALCSGLTSAFEVSSSYVPSFWSSVSAPEEFQISLPSYADIETSIAPSVGQVEVYKVHHHGSRFSSNETWMNVIRPKIGIISAGAGNSYGHPTADALARIHLVGTRTYWTSVGGGAGPVPGWDVVAGTTAVEVSPGAASFTVRYGADIETYPMWGFSTTPALSGPPLGVIDTPAEMSVVAGEVPFTGWAIDNTGVAGVDIYRSPLRGEQTSPNGLVYVGAATQIEGARPDIVASFGLYPGTSRAGWGLMVLSNFLPNGGNGTFTLHAVARSTNGQSAIVASRTIVAANKTSAFPFGTIDTPGQGETISGNAYVNFGWALTPNPKTIPTDGSTITVLVDGVAVGHPSYNHYRADIASLFPGLVNSNGAVGFFVLDTTALSNGLHTISWAVTDNAGAVQGVGSRFFRVQNP